MGGPAETGTSGCGWLGLQQQGQWGSDLRKQASGCSFLQIWELGNGWVCQNGNVGMRVAGSKTVRLANPRVGQWLGLPKWECWGTGSWECKNKNSKTVRLANLRVGQWPGLPKWERQGAGGCKCKNKGCKTVRLTNLRVGQWLGLPKQWWVPHQASRVFLQLAYVSRVYE